MPAVKTKTRKPRTKVKDDKVSTALKDVKGLVRQYERAIASGHVTLAVNCADAMMPAIKHLRILAERNVKARYGDDFEIPVVGRVSKNEDSNNEDNESSEEEEEEECEDCEHDCSDDDPCPCECHDDDDEDEDDDD